MSDRYHELMSHLFNSPSNILKSSYQLTGIMHCRVANDSSSAARSSGLPAYAVVDWSEEREAARFANLPTYATQRRRFIDTIQDKRKNHASQKDVMSTPLRKRRKVHTSGEWHMRKSFPLGQPFSSIKRSKLCQRHTLARFLWHRRGLLCILKQSNWFEKISTSL